MAYFSNSSEGAVFDEQCSRCKYGQENCPVAVIQTIYNYDALNNEVATNIMNELVRQDGTCTIFEMARKDFEIDPNQIEMGL